MIRLPTQTKIAIARWMSRSVRAARALAGKPDSRLVCERGGLRWSLDLTDGIDFAIYLMGRFEPSTARALARNLRPGRVALDIGANVGAHALPMAKAVAPDGKVYAIEPTDHAFSKLMANVSLNPSLQASLVPLQLGLTEVGGTLPGEIYSRWELAPGDGQHPVHGGSLSSTAQAERMTLDELVEKLALKRLDLIKMDVDGYECKILRGAGKTLARFKPVILLELCPYAQAEHGGSFEELISTLTGHGYAFFNESGSRRLPSDPRELSARIPERGSINALARVGVEA